MTQRRRSDRAASAGRLFGGFRQRITIDDARSAVVAAFILMLPLFSRLLVFINQFTTNLDHPLLNSTFVSPTDVLLVAAIVLAIPLALRNERSSYGIVTRGAAGMAIIVGIAVALNPTIEGTTMLVRTVGIVAVVLIAVSLSPTNFALAIVWPLAISAAIQSTIALLQTFVWNNGMTVDATIATSGRWTAGHGTFTEPYNLPAFLGLTIAVLLVEYVRGRGNSLHMISIVVSSAAVATTFGRTAAISLVVVGSLYLVASLISRRKDHLLAGLASLAPLLATGIVLRSGWLARIAESPGLTDDIRWSLARRAIEIIADNPIVGVGPAQYALHIPTSDGFIVHSVPLLAAAEFGIAVGLALTVWLTVLCFRSFQRSIPTGAIFASALPYLILDNLHYVLAVGLGMVAIWLAAVARDTDRANTGGLLTGPPVTFPDG